MKLTIRVSLLFVWLTAASLALSYELLVMALIIATAAMIVPTFVVGWWRERVTLVADGRRPVDLRTGPEFPQ